MPAYRQTDREARSTTKGGKLGGRGILALLNQSRYSLHLKHMSAVTHAQVLNGAH